MKKGLLLAIFALSCVMSICVHVVGASSGSGSSNSSDRSVGEVIDDTVIWSGIEREFVNKGFSDLFAKINLKVSQGRVYMSGNVDSMKHVKQAIEIAWSRPGVVEVVSDLKVDHQSKAGDSSISHYAQDALITGKVKSKILLEKDIKSMNYSIVTEDNVVYLFGVAGSAQELKKVCDVAKKVEGVVDVVSHVRVLKK